MKEKGSAQSWEEQMTPVLRVKIPWDRQGKLLGQEKGCACGGEVNPTMEMQMSAVQFLAVARPVPELYQSPFSHRPHGVYTGDSPAIETSVHRNVLLHARFVLASFSASPQLVSD